MGLTIFSKNETTRVIKTSEDFEYKFSTSKGVEKKRKKTWDELYHDCKMFALDIMGEKYAGHSFQSQLD